jgi:hypothetical protein
MVAALASSVLTGLNLQESPGPAFLWIFAGILFLVSSTEV